MATLPSKTNFTDSAVTKAGFKAALDQLRDYLSGLLGDNGTAATARSTLGLGSAATQADDRYAHRANNLSDLGSAAAARNNLGLGTAATGNTGSGNGFDADLLDGQHGSYYADIPSRLGFHPVRQGGGTGMSTTNIVRLGLGSSRLLAQIDSTPYGYVWTSVHQAGTFAVPGYVRLPNGFTMQWGSLTSVGPNSGVNVTFPLTFGSAVFGGWATCVNPSNEGGFASALNISNLSVSGMRVISPEESAKAARWFAIGA